MTDDNGPGEGDDPAEPPPPAVSLPAVTLPAVSAPTRTSPPRPEPPRPDPPRPASPRPPLPGDLAASAASGSPRAWLPIGVVVMLAVVGGVLYFATRGDREIALFPTAVPTSAASSLSVTATPPPAGSPGATPVPLPTTVVPPIGSALQPLAFARSVPVNWAGRGLDDRAVWNVTVSRPRDLTGDVLAANQFNEPPPDEVVFAGFDVELTLASAEREPISFGPVATWELVGGSTGASYGPSTVDGLVGCGVVDGEFDRFAQVMVGGTVRGTVCLPLPAVDLAHPDTAVAIRVDSAPSATFETGGAAPPPADITSRGPVALSVERGLDAPVPVVFDSRGENEGSVWNLRVGALRDLTEDVLGANAFNDPPPDGAVFAGFDAELQLASAEQEPLVPGLAYRWEIIGGATDVVYTSSTLDGLGCGPYDDSWNSFAEMLVGGSESGVVCVPLPIEDLEHPDTVISFNLYERRFLFVAGADTPAPTELDESTGPSEVGVLAAYDTATQVPLAIGASPESSWEVTVGPLRDVGDQVVAGSTIPRRAEPGTVFAGFDVEMTLGAGSGPQAVGFNASWEIIGGANLRVYNDSSVSLLGCGSFDGEFDRFTEVGPGETLQGTVCLPIPVEDLEHPDTIVALQNEGVRHLFGG